MKEIVLLQCSLLRLEREEYITQRRKTTLSPFPKPPLFASFSGKRRIWLS
jgi:hypothetical protein